MLILTEEQVLCQGLEFVGFTREQQQSVNSIKNEERFKSHFGSLPIVYAQLLMALQETSVEAAKVHDATPSDFRYFMMATYFLKVYPTENQAEGI